MKLRVNNRITITIPENLENKLMISIPHVKDYREQDHNILWSITQHCDYNTAIVFLDRCLKSRVTTDEERQYLRKLRTKVVKCAILEIHYNRFLKYVNDENNHDLDCICDFGMKKLFNEKFDIWDFSKFILHLKKNNLF